MQLLKFKKNILFAFCLLSFSSQTLAQVRTEFLKDSILTFISYVHTGEFPVYPESCLLELVKRDDSITRFYKTYYCNGNLENEKIPETMSDYPVEAILQDSLINGINETIVQAWGESIRLSKSKKNPVDSLMFVKKILHDSMPEIEDLLSPQKFGYKVINTLIDSEGNRVYVVTNKDTAIIKISPHYMYKTLWLSEKWGLIRSRFDGNGYGHSDIILNSFIKYKLGEYETYYQQEIESFGYYFDSLKPLN